ncbi:prolyl oligopeptidase [Xylariales sp. PMI_506]|nr:prolyl oligopeptidase [Xylariales sp. PMI_506]
MTPVRKLSPEVLVTIPRRGATIPNRDGTLAIFSESTHVIGGETSRGYWILDIKTGKTEQLLADDKATNIVWLGSDDNTLLYLSGEEGGYTSVKTADARNPSAEPSVVGSIEAPVSYLKVKPLEDGSIALVVVGLVDADGNIYNKEQHKTSHSARVTDNINPRIWDSYVLSQKYTLWYTTIIEHDGLWELKTPLRDILAGTKLSTPICVYEPGDHADDFDIGVKGIVFAATEDDIFDPTKPVSKSIYHLPLSALSTTSGTDLPTRMSVQIDADTQSTSHEEWCSHPRFNHDESAIAFLRAPTMNSLDESIWIKRLPSPSAVDVFTTVTGAQWNLIPSNFEFAPDSQSLYIQAQNSGRVSLFELELRTDAIPTAIGCNGSVSSYHVLHNKDKHDTARLLITSSSLIDPWICQIVKTDGVSGLEPRIISNLSEHVDLGLSRDQISETYFEGAGEYNVHAWVVKPSNFDVDKKYPLCILVHGGPYAAWTDAWSTRWNPAVWAEQGYVVVTPNITGSQGFGFELNTSIRNNWGGRPYDDLVKCLEHAKNIPGIDVENAVAAGNSYGGYMMNWIQGHPLGRRFKALVCHDGIFHIPNFLLESDRLASKSAEFGGEPFAWSNSEGLERYNPARPELLKNWKTPMLVIHSDKDYRVPINHGLAAFHTLKALGTPARFLSFPDENHWVSKEENSLEWHRQVFTWINKWCKATGEVC